MRPRQLALVDLGPSTTGSFEPDGDHGVGPSTMGSLEPDGDYGEVFTRRWVVELILDLAGYTPDQNLLECVAVEPACGRGAFLRPMVERIIASARLHDRSLTEAKAAIRAFDLVRSNVNEARRIVVAELIDAGLAEEEATALADEWIEHDDFLLRQRGPDAVDFVLGNPPYIRLEGVPRARTDAYRRACPAMRGRSDVYVGFIEAGLELLRTGGTLGFIVADRWMHNQYGAGLRKLIASKYSVESVIEMHDVDAFDAPVSAYPAVIVISKGVQGRAVLSTTTPEFGAKQAAELKSWVARDRRGSINRPSFSAASLKSWFPANQLWPSGDPESLAVVADLEREFPPLEDPRTGTRVGIGVATGADSIYLTRDRDLIEEDRLLPLATAADTATGRLLWSGMHLINPWRDGELVDLADHPRLRSYFEAHGAALRARHVAKNRPGSWFRTIDRVDPTLLARPKLLLPDLKASIHPVLDDGEHYPHHNLYFVVSDGWDMEVLGGLLLSDVANLFVGTYCVKMRGGCYRFQAQYVRRIRVPQLALISRLHARALAKAFRERDVEAATATAMSLYGIDAVPAVALSRTG